MKAGELAVPQKSCWRNIPISLIDRAPPGQIERLVLPNLSKVRRIRFQDSSRTSVGVSQAASEGRKRAEVWLTGIRPLVMRMQSFDLAVVNDRYGGNVIAWFAKIIRVSAAWHQGCNFHSLSFFAAVPNWPSW